MNTTLADAVVTESVRWVEATGPLDDAEAMHAALALHDLNESLSDGLRDSGSGIGAARITERARVLGRRIGLASEVARMRAWAPWMLLALVAVVVIAGLGVAGNVVGGDRKINVMVALVSLLGLHALTLLIWLAGLALPVGSFGVFGTSFNASLGGLWLMLTARVAGGKRGQAPVLMRATTGLLARAKLMPWALGLVSHTIWTLSFAVIVAALLFALAFRNYALSWETTILEPAFFVRSVQALGVVPSWLGFPVPDAQMVLAAPAVAPDATPYAASLAAQRVWALWLTGCVVVYGLLPRLLLALWSAAVWQARKKALRPDLRDAYYLKLLARFDALQPPRVVDADSGRLRQAAVQGLAAGDTSNALWVIGFELPDEAPWPIAVAMPTGAHPVRVDGGATQRAEVLATLADARPAQAIVVCSGASSPDRGTERFVREVQARCGECRLWLWGVSTTPGRWRDWMAEVGVAPWQDDGPEHSDAHTAAVALDHRSETSARP
ncbi:MAG: hypothetical protein JWQ73_3197 [Variovorax sp.]|nr:hypothetical protein [Variovorax sp.]